MYVRTHTHSLPCFICGILQSNSLSPISKILSAHCQDILRMIMSLTCLPLNTSQDAPVVKYWSRSSWFLCLNKSIMIVRCCCWLVGQLVLSVGPNPWLPMIVVGSVLMVILVLVVLVSYTPAVWCRYWCPRMLMRPNLDEGSPTNAVLVGPDGVLPAWASIDEDWLDALPASIVRSSDTHVTWK